MIGWSLRKRRLTFMTATSSRTGSLSEAHAQFTCRHTDAMRGDAAGGAVSVHWWTFHSCPSGWFGSWGPEVRMTGDLWPLLRDSGRRLRTRSFSFSALVRKTSDFLQIHCFFTRYLSQSAQTFTSLSKGTQWRGGGVWSECFLLKQEIAS